jgi:hypothetical protein
MHKHIFIPASNFVAHSKELVGAMEQIDNEGGKIVNVNHNVTVDTAKHFGASELYSTLIIYTVVD